MNIVKEIKRLNDLGKLGLIQEVQDIIAKLPISLEEIGELIYNEDYDANDHVSDLTNIIEFLQNIFNNTDLPELVSNDLYDKLYEKYKNETGKDMVGSSTIPVGKKTCPHKYPHLRGSLDKVHYLKKSEVSKGDNRKNLQDWIEKCLNLLPSNKVINLLSRYKYDGVSLVFEYSKDLELQKVLTRGDTDQNLGQDVTDTFKAYTFNELFGTLLHDLEFNDDFAIKTECLMTYDNFRRYNEEKGLTLNNTRSAITSFINSEDHNYEDLIYVTLEVLEISSGREILPNVDNVNCVMFDVSTTGDFFNYVVFDTDANNHVFKISKGLFENNSGIVDDLELFIELIKADACNDKMYEPIDGIVFTIWDNDIIKGMGRKDNINKFQIAFKFPAGVKKSIVKNVTFQVGLMGGITPVVTFEPVTIMGNTIENSSTGSINKLKQLNLNIGDEIIVKYDIIPIISVDDTCKKGTGEKVISPTECPICHEELVSEGLNIYCNNDECDSRIIGKIINYTNKLDIKHIGVETITILVQEGFLNTIGDLYRLPDKLHSIITIKGFKEHMMNKIFSSLFSKTELYAHDLLGSLGINSIGRRVMEKVCRAIPFKELIEDINDLRMIHKLNSIKGIGDKMTGKIVNGVFSNQALIEDLLRYITIKPYENKEYNETVVFTKVRDKDFENYLEELGIKVASSYSTKVDIVITKDVNDNSTKIEKAKKDGKLVLSLEDAKTKYEYV